MYPDLKISSLLLERLQAVNQRCSGCLFGVFYGDGTLLLLGFNLESTIGKLNYEKIQYKFPAEVDLCGLVKFGDCTDTEAHLNHIIKSVDITDNPILLNCELGTTVGLKASIFMHGKLQDIPYSILEESQLYEEFCFTRLKCVFKIYAERSTKDIHHEFNLLRKKLSSGSLAFQLEPLNIYVTNSGINSSANDIDSLKNGCVISTLINYAVGSSDFAKDDTLKNISHSNQKKDLCNIYGALGCSYDVLYLNVLQSKTKEEYSLITNDDRLSNGLSGPTIQIQCNGDKVCIPLEVEAMAMLSKSTKLHRLYDVLIESICRALRLIEHSMCDTLAETNTLLIPKSYYFFPKNFGHFISCSYLIGVDDDDIRMQDKRKRLHRHFGLPVTRPYFRRSNRCLFRNEITFFQPLLNIHKAIHSNQPPEGKLYLVHGDYFYYHYLQNEISDSGWGCAYRSIQTICSWFLLQGYTQRNVPLHRDIQKCLVEVGDKPKSFEGSTQWIGSTEVGIFLQSYLNVESKVKHVQSGSDLIAIVPDLITHFLLHGTPVMIGGGKLAHTIIGIDFDSQTSRVKYLILDPHYTGTDDVKNILVKGFCGWKGPDFWDKKSYYNLCMPQKPTMF